MVWSEALLAYRGLVWQVTCHAAGLCVISDPDELSFITASGYSVTIVLFLIHTFGEAMLRLWESSNNERDGESRAAKPAAGGGSRPRGWHRLLLAEAAKERGGREEGLRSEGAVLKVIR